MRATPTEEPGLFSESALHIERRDLILIGIGIAIGIAVCYPFFGGRLLLLDWVSGPHQGIVPASTWGLGSTSAAGLPWELTANILDWMFGQAGSWIPALLFFPLAIFSASKLAGGKLVGGIAAGLLFTINPFVFDRIFVGQISLLIGYALLPLATRSLIRTVAGGMPWSAGLWIGTLVACSIQFAWILAVVAIVAFILSRERRLRSLARLAGAGAIGAALNAYTILNLGISGSQLRASLGQLAAYQTSGDPHVGLFVNIAGLYGFWRPGPREPKYLLGGWIFFLFAILTVVAVGYITKIRKQNCRSTALCLLASGVIGYFLAFGAQGPTGIVYRFAYLQVPGFAMMREPEKFSMLLALCYACGFGWGVDWLATEAKTMGGRVAIGVVALALPWAYTPNLVAGLGGQIHASSFPTTWQTVAQIVEGRSTVLFLPWHKYQAFPFTANRVVATPAEQYFPAPTLSSEDAGPGYQLGPVSLEDSFVSSVVRQGSSAANVGALLASIGVRWVVLAKVNDWRSYSWLGHQRDLRLVLDGNNVMLYRNLNPLATPNASRSTGR